MDSDWQSAEGERERLRILATYPLTDPAFSEQLDRLTRLAARICDVPIAVVSLVEEERQSFIGRYGLSAASTPRAYSFCAHAMFGEAAMTVGDAREDARFADNPLVTGDPNIRFYAGEPLRSPEGAPLGAFCVIDDTPRRALDAEQAEALQTLAQAAMALLQKHRIDASHAAIEQRFNVLADAMPQMVWSSRPDGYSDYFNRRWCTFTGALESVSHGAGWMQFLHPDDHDLASEVWGAAVASGEDYEIRYRLRRHDGAYRWVLARGLPMLGADGAVTRWIGTCTDIHEQTEAGEALEVLSQELSHRIKNIFAVIGGLISLSTRNHPELAPLGADMQGRVLALGLAHDFIRPAQIADGGARRSLKGMLASLLTPYDDGKGTRFAITGPDLPIDDRSATPFALFFHELATNAAKYGALSRSEGRVEIALTGGDPVEIAWTERGGPPVDVPAESHFGSRLIEISVERQLGGSLAFDWNPAGLRLVARIPLASMSRDSMSRDSMSRDSMSRD
jgi:PAS domain S-box-containing protein